MTKCNLRFHTISKYYKYSPAHSCTTCTAFEACQQAMNRSPHSVYCDNGRCGCHHFVCDDPAVMAEKPIKRCDADD